MLAGAVQLWPTATAQDCVGSGSAGYPAVHPVTGNVRNVGTTLTDAANGLWATPSREERAKRLRDGVELNLRLSAEARKANLWATASARDWRSGEASEATHARNSRPLNEQVTRLYCEAGPPDPESSSASGKRRDWPTARAERFGAPDSHGRAPIRGSLNPAWVAQVMGVPDGWLDGCDVPSSKPLETESSPRSSRKSAAPSSRRKRA